MEIIKLLIVNKHFVDEGAIDSVLSKLSELRILHLNAAIAKCDNGVDLLGEVKEALKMQRKRLEASLKVCLLIY